MTHAEFGVHRLAQLLHEAVVDAALHQKAVGAHARLQKEDEDRKHYAAAADITPTHSTVTSYLSGVPELGAHGSGHRLVHVSAVKHDEGGVASQLHRRLLHCVGSHFQQHLKQ